jgi:CDP-glycerol glycerophosphotransferase (TagB/SpsB family)
MTRSWDNLTSHGALRVVPNRLIVQNTFLRDAARGVQGIRICDSQIDIVGLPHYDFYDDTSMLETRESFFEKNNLDLSKKVILYCGMGEFLFKCEGDIIDILEEDIDQGIIEKSTQVLYSVHPKFRTSLERARNKKHIRPSAEILYLDSREEIKQHQPIRDLINLIYHSDVVVMGASTMAIDSAMFDRPIVCVAFDGYATKKEIPHWISVKRLYDSYTHFEALLKTGGVQIAHDRIELATLINRYLHNPTLERENRKKIVERFVGPRDGRAGERLARILSTEIENI